MDKNIASIEGMDLNLGVIIKQLRYDMRDDWFPDSLNYDDILDVEYLLPKFSKFTKSSSTLYLGYNAKQYDIPKQGFVIRYALEMSVLDRLIYQSLATRLIRHCDHTLSSCVFSHRWSREPNSKYLFRDPIEAWKQFQDAVSVNLTSKTPFLLVTDVQNFFENIRITDIKHSLEKALNKAKLNNGEHSDSTKAIEMICRLLRRWTPYKGHGIPQNRDASSFLGNMIMSNVDEAMLKKGYNYFRYMDDICVVCENEFQARKALMEFIIELRKICLNVNAKKSFIYHKDDVNIRNHIIKKNRLVEQIDALWKTKRITDIKITLPLLQKMTLKLISDNKTQEREFRFCLYRLQNVARCKEIRSSFDFSLITSRIISELPNQPYSSDSLVTYLKCVDLTAGQLDQIASLLSNDKKCIYSWQNYHLWQLLVNHRYFNAELCDFAKKVICKQTADPNQAGAILYLGACGDDIGKIAVARSFKRMKSYLVQRSALIATHDLSWSNYIKPFIKPYVREDLIGTYRTLSRNYRGVYFKPLESISPSNLYRDIPTYNSDIV